MERRASPHTINPMPPSFILQQERRRPGPKNGKGREQMRHHASAQCGNSRTKGISSCSVWPCHYWLCNLVSHVGRRGGHLPGRCVLSRPTRHGKPQEIRQASRLLSEGARRWVRMGLDRHV